MIFNIWPCDREHNWDPTPSPLRKWSRRAMSETCKKKVCYFPIKDMQTQPPSLSFDHSLLIDDTEPLTHYRSYGRCCINEINNKKILWFLAFEIWLIWYNLKSEKYDQKNYFRPISMKFCSGTFQTILRKKSF